MSKEAEDTYSLEELAHAVKEMEFARGHMTEAQNELNAKRAAIKSFEEAEASASLNFEKWAREVKKIAAKLRK